MTFRTISKEYKIDCFRGNELNVMKRVLDAGSKFDADIIVEITGCPIIDPLIVEQVVKHLLLTR